MSRDELTSGADAAQARIAYELRLAQLERERDEARAEVDKRDDFLRHEGYRRCDIAACNCGSWHAPPNKRAEKAEADNAALREALNELHEWGRKRWPPAMGGDQYPVSIRDAMNKAHAALASPHPGAEYVSLERVREEWPCPEAGHGEGYSGPCLVETPLDLCPRCAAIERLKGGK